ncbi:hypothetical protein SMD20_46510 [Nonomuraea sp. LP-02]|uniref:hypothetical protein n=1 Tax=Nonomuraea sp. LP-02 TaxID=3097960 RepID=UPI002E3316D4|nr:hypothetical protein [Nonomuraea sp. LP-02]MED7931742.1 hypothetical protein [Nonomuraea sp. LP-02]
MEHDPIAALTRAVNADDPISSLAAIAEFRRELARMEAVAVRRARTQGHSWTEIAAALGLSKQAVHKKHGGRGLFRAQD